MRQTVYDRLFKRELGDSSRYSKIRGVYGDKKWVDGLDIVNELDGHSGCVNALSWSRSGRLLASGSDDTNINIHSYLPELSTSQFNLTTTISTGHTANIFSVKFMPYSNDRTIVTAAGDAEVRIFDIEYSGQSSVPSPIRGRGRGSSGSQHGQRYRGYWDTNSKVFCSHTDRVKRIVTESSPFFFLTCSEDGEVRQWDLREPSSTYQRPEGYRPLSAPNGTTDHPPPALISYKPYQLDLNTISCSPSQPHYIALGGAHLHCFLHDRRMLGRDKLLERGTPPSSPSNWSDRDDDQMNLATRCVRKFAPHGRKQMKRRGNGHITACKISDANPNELIVSWSGDYIYSFDLVQSPDADDQQDEAVSGTLAEAASSRVKESKSRKRKRAKAGSSAAEEDADRGASRPRTESTTSGTQSQIALMVQYENGQSEQIPIEPSEERSTASGSQDAYTEGERASFRVAKTTVKLRKSMFVLGAPKAVSAADPSGHAASFTSVLGFAASILPDMDEIMKSWRYPVSPKSIDVTVQNTLREGRGSIRRFVQASGTLARVLGGKLRTGGSSESMIEKYFTTILPVAHERGSIPPHEQFAYDFLKAILLWLDSGVGAILEGFTPSGELSRGSPRFPIPTDSPMEAIDEILIPYLLHLASAEPVISVDSSRFEVDENRIVFSSEKAAVVAFAKAVKIPFEDLSSAAVATSPDAEEPSATASISAQDRRTALRFWALKVGRGLLFRAGKDVSFATADRAFGGRGVPDTAIKEEESTFETRFEEVDPDEEDDVVANATLVSRLWREETGASAGDGSSGARAAQAGRSTTAATENENDESRGRPPFGAAVDDDDDDDDDGAGDGDDSDEREENSSDDEDEGESQVLYRTVFPRRGTLREKVEENVPCASHTRLYRGHCNVKTVKDVNFYGLQDEYVVSGSDCGNLFIWDKKTSELVNILEGDGEVVNVVQGHPYEPLIAVSGIDDTIKIFSADGRARWNARRGIGVSAADTSTFSSLDYGRRWRSPRTGSRRPTSEPAAPAPTTQRDPDSEDDGEVAVNGLRSKRRLHEEYQITSSNDEEMRAGGNRGGAFISRALFQQLVAHVQERLNADEGGEEGDGEGGLFAQLIQSGECSPM